MQKNDKVKIISGPYKGQQGKLHRRDYSNSGWYVITDDKELIFVDDKEIRQ